MSRDDVQFAVCPTTLITLRCVGCEKKEDAETKSSSKHLMKPIIGVKSFFLGTVNGNKKFLTS